MSWKELFLSECKISYFIDVLHEMDGTLFNQYP